MVAMNKMTGRLIFVHCKFIIHLLVCLVGLLPTKLISFLFHLSRGISGKIGILIRYLLLSNLAKCCGENVVIKENVYIYSPNKIEFGDNVSIHPLCYLDASGDIYIGDNVSIAHSTSIMTTNHSWENKEIPIKYNAIDCGKVTIHSDVWIGCGVRILAGVEIFSHSIVAAGCVVTKDVSSDTLVAGVPLSLIHI